MVFLSICTALYDYTPQADGELPLTEGELVYVLEKDTEDDWWKAKKKAPDDEEEEPMGLVPNNYVEEVSIPRRQCRPLTKLRVYGLGSTFTASKSAVRLLPADRRRALLFRRCDPRRLRPVRP